MRRPLLRLDPSLGGYLSPERRAAAEPLLWTVVVDFPRGPWRPGRPPAGRPAGLGLLLLHGLLARQVLLADPPSAELLGPGDIIRPFADDEPTALDAHVRWTALRACRMAVLDPGVTRVCMRFPEVMMAVLDRAEARSRRLAVTQAISQLTGVDRRLEALLWHLADRWGRVTRDGTVVPLQLTHRMLGTLVGARRPTVSTALGQLAEAGRVLPLGSSGWLLPPPPPGY